MQYRPEIDGLRAVAVLPVILFHAGFLTFSGGFVGVDVFFVISGYLITMILISERDAGTYSLLGFYERRARRILPALFFVMICAIPFAWRLLSPDQFEDYARSQAFAALFISNIHFLENSAYHDIASDYRPLLHTWSLAVEEQYYMLFPLVLLPLGAFMRRRYLAVFLILAALSLALAEWGWRNYPSENFYFTFSRLWEILAGSICAAILFRRPQMTSDALALAGLVMIGASIVFYTSAVPFPSVYTLLPVAGSMLIILFAGAGTWVARLLSLRPMVGIGLISYSAYLWHQPLFAFARIRSLSEPSLWVMSALSVLTLVLAWLTMRYVEVPFRRRKWVPGRTGMLTASAASIVIIAGFGFVGHENDGFPSRVKEATPGWLTTLYERLRVYEVDTTCKDGESDEDRPLCTVFAAENETEKLAVMGDSHAWGLVPALARLPVARGVTVMRGAQGACPPLLGVYRAKGDQPAIACHDFARAAAHQAVQAGVSTVILAARWSLYVSGEFADPRMTHGLTPVPGSRSMSLAERETGFTRALKDTISFYRDAGIRVVLAEEVPLQWVRADDTVARAILLGLDEETSREMFRNSYVSRERSDALQGPSRRVLNEVAEQTGVDVIRLLDYFRDGGQYLWLRNDTVLYTDTNHLSEEGARAMIPFIEAVLTTH